MHGGAYMVPDDAGIKVPPDRPETTLARLANAVAYMYDHPEKREEMGKYAFRFIQEEVMPMKRRFLKAFLKELPTVA